MNKGESMKHAEESLARATTSASFANYPAILAGFAAKGIDDIRPRENVFTFAAWLQLGRVVEKGQTGVKITTWVQMNKDGETFARPKTVSVFHISQTKPTE
jgi:hypothetical protein